LIGWHIIASPHDEVSEVAPGYKTLRTEVKVSVTDFFAVRDAEAPIKTGRIFFLRQTKTVWPARARVHGSSSPSFGALAAWATSFHEHLHG
jgi:hypothetical protein